MGPKFKAYQSKWNNTWKITKLQIHEIISIEILYQNCSCSKLDNDGKTQHESTKGVVPHYIEWHQKKNFLNHKKWYKLDQWVTNTFSKFEAQTQSAFGVTTLGYH
jgi:hypothetical protein